MKPPLYYVQVKWTHTRFFRPRARPVARYILAEVDAEGEPQREVVLDEEKRPIEKGYRCDYWICDAEDLRRQELQEGATFITGERFEACWNAAPAIQTASDSDTFDMRKRSFLEDARLRAADSTFRISATIGLVSALCIVGVLYGLIPHAGFMPFALMFAAIPTCCFIAGIRWLREIPWTLSRTTCSNCGYDLRGCPEPAEDDMLRCPECGLSPDDRVSTPPIEWHVGLIGIFFLIIAIVGALLIVVSVLPSFG